MVVRGMTTALRLTAIVGCSADAVVAKTHASVVSRMDEDPDEMNDLLGF